MPYRVTQYMDGERIHSKTTRFLWRAKFWKWVYAGASPMGTFYYTTSLEEVDS